MNTLLISPTKLDRIQQCEELFRYSYVKELSTFQKPTYQDEGDLFHFFLENYYKNKRDSKDYNIDHIIELGRNRATSLNLNYDELDENIRLFREYVTYYAMESWRIDDVEVPFAVELFKSEELDLQIVMEGKIDLLATEEKTNTRIVVDHKRVSRNYTPYDRDNQKLAYCLASGRRDFIINQIGDQKSYDVDKRLRRYWFTYADHQIAEFVENSIEWSLEMIKVMKADKDGTFVRRNYNSCYHFNIKCMFYDVCNTTEDNKVFKLDQAYKPKVSFDLFEG
jgi:hypothetical protein